MSTERDPAVFTIPLPGGRVARVPLAELLRHVDPEARAHHGPEEQVDPADVSFHSVVIEYGDGDKIILRHTDLEDLSHKNFDSARHFDLG